MSPTDAFAETRLALPGGGVLGLRRQRGAGLPMLLLHGISSGSGSWAGVAAALPGRELIAWDAPGYGQSTPLASDAPDAAAYADVAVALIDALDLPQVALVGHSLGTLVATAVAARLGAARVPELHLISPARGYGADAARAAEVRTQRLQALAAQGIPGLAAGLSARLLTPDASEAARTALRHTAERMTARGYAQAVNLLCTGDLPTLARCAPGLVGIALRVAVGSEDVVTPPAACAALADELGAPFTLLPGLPHASPVQDPAAVARWIAATAGALHG